jgi:alkanesulfonate monooxygenase SsuD/methylene tetrahydromethanopterin reductase-like flavin-dependent oxidoreductase (luciferase family)
MKFSLFAHLEAYHEEPSHRQLLKELTDLVLLAEKGGFETFWIGEHHGMGYTVAPNPFLNLAFLANQTKTIRLGTGTVIAPFWHPIALAGEAALCDVMSDGRLDLGIARGAYTFEYERLKPGLDAMDAGARMREMVPALQQLFQGDYAHDGQYWQFPSTTPMPYPIQQPHPPMWIAARDPMSHDFAVANHCNVQVTSLTAGDTEVANLMERFNKACADHPDIARPEIMMLMHTYVAETEEEILQGTKDLQAFYVYFNKWFKRERPITKGLMEPIRQEDIDALPHLALENIRKNLVVGTPSQVIERLKQYEAMGYDQYSLWMDNHMSHAQKCKCLDLFIKEVLPAFS